jgi:hypothetical protein
MVISTRLGGIVSDMAPEAASSATSSPGRAPRARISPDIPDGRSSDDEAEPCFSQRRPEGSQPGLFVADVKRGITHSLEDRATIIPA